MKGKKLKIRSSTCQQVTKCECGENVQKNRGRHECGKSQCRICKKMVEQPHHCYIQVIFHFMYHSFIFLFQTIDETKESPPFYIFYDMETSQEKTIDQSDYGEIHEHVVNFISATKVCFLICFMSYNV